MLSLVIMAAGLGTRYKGGIKQLAKIGKNDETIMELSINAAIKAGFNEVIFILRKDIFDEFKNQVGNKVEKLIKTKYVFQDVTDIPVEFENKDRTKPWGTGHAVLSIKSINNPFVVINADDYYGVESFQKLADFFKEEKPYNYAMVGYKLKNTLSKNGGVSRGICKVENGYLKDVVEMKNLTEDSPIDMDTIVSMNMWGFTSTMLEELKKSFTEFLKIHSKELDSEFFLPYVVKELIDSNKITVKVLETNELWYGLTYMEDLEYVKESIGEKEC